jgi:hypothetical protein
MGRGVNVDRLASLNLIRVFDFYLAVMFLFSLLRRWRVYRDAIVILVSVRGRWPRLLGRMALYRAEVLNWATFRPVVLALALTVVQWIASRMIWPTAELMGRDVAGSWWKAVVLLAAFVPMAWVDGYFLVRVGRFDRDETEKYFDQAEKWAGTWRARAVRVGTLGYVNPDRMVDLEVRKGLSEIGATVVWSMRWVSTQIALRLVFGLALWGVWFVG